MFFSAGHSIPLYSILRVFFVRSDDGVLSIITADGVVARMTENHSFWDRTYVNFICYSAGISSILSKFAAKTDYTVAFNGRSLPRPAFIWIANFNLAVNGAFEGAIPTTMIELPSRKLNATPRARTFRHGRYCTTSLDFASGLFVRPLSGIPVSFLRCCPRSGCACVPC